MSSTWGTHKMKCDGGCDSYDPIITAGDKSYCVRCYSLLAVRGDKFKSPHYMRAVMDNQILQQMATDTLKMAVKQEAHVYDFIFRGEDG